VEVFKRWSQSLREKVPIVKVIAKFLQIAYSQTAKRHPKLTKLFEFGKRRIFIKLMLLLTRESHEKS